MVPNITPASVVLWFSPRGGWIGSRVNRHGCREEAGLLGVELIVGYSSLFLFIAGFVVMSTTVWDRVGEREGGREGEERQREKVEGKEREKL